MTYARIENNDGKIQIELLNYKIIKTKRHLLKERIFEAVEKVLSENIPEKGKIVLLTHTETGSKSIGFFVNISNDQYWIAQTHGKLFTKQNSYGVACHKWEYVL